MMVVVILLHVNCFAQYALCGLNLGYKRSERPAIGVAICISSAIAAPAIAGLYAILSPLGKDYDSEMDEEAQNRPQWSGGIMDIWDDISVAYLSFFCTFCVFGWNMERLGFGNMYVHIATFVLFCMAPFWIFILAAGNIDNDNARQAMIGVGIALCLVGLLYGGFWRIQMRKRFNLPSYYFCFGKPSVSDCTLWLCCCCCSVAQEARTGNSYDVVEDKFCRKQDDISVQPPISPLPREDANSPVGIRSPPSKAGTSRPLAPSDRDGEMRPPVPPVIHRESL
ncbi:hypothetical protein K1719_045816 [Acacia pycnantha]|nr:hypothetical protein K1719_045816 [Acacia pycnantha]